MSVTVQRIPFLRRLRREIFMVRSIFSIRFFVGKTPNVPTIS